MYVNELSVILELNQLKKGNFSPEFTFCSILASSRKCKFYFELYEFLFFRQNNIKF